MKTPQRIRFRRIQRSLLLMGLIVVGTNGLEPWPEAFGQDPPPSPTPVAEGPDAGGAPAAAAGQDDPDAPQVLTRGAIHEAFAAPVVHDPAAAPLVAKQPPDPIQEMPPDQRPSGQNVQWIPGYWSWDVSRNDYIWISGIWREPPPNSQWVPGYWHQVDGGNQWVSGTWIPVSTGPAQGDAAAAQAQSQPSYLPAPPKTLEAGPTTPQPNPNVAWTPGFWSWQGTNYAWRPGFWAAVQPNWIWMPAHYVWTPSGYLFVGGYWDLPVANRGLMFAPVYYPQPVYVQPSFVFTPSISIVGSAVTANLFVSAGTGQYMFGDFYAQNFVSVGITPWFSFSFSSGPPVFYDPIFSYYAVVNIRQNPHWVTEVRREYVLRRDNVAMRPPHTYIEETRMIERGGRGARGVAMPLNRLAAERGMRMERVSQVERQQLHRQVTAMHEFREQRVKQEREGARRRRGGSRRDAAAADEPAPFASRCPCRRGPCPRGPAQRNAPRRDAPGRSPSRRDAASRRTRRPGTPLRNAPGRSPSRRGCTRSARACGSGQVSNGSSS